MDHLNSLSAYGAHPKDFDPEQVEPVLVNLDIITKWYLKFKDFQITGKSEEVKSESRARTISPPEKSIIVLPFENMSSDFEQEYFSDGLTEKIITALSHIRDFLVISRNSAMTFKGTKKKTSEIASEVNVKYVLEGSVSTEIPETHWGQLALFLMHAYQGEKSKALQIVTEDFIISMKGDPWFAVWNADSYALMGLKEESIEWVEYGVNCITPFTNYPFLNEYDPHIENIRGEERFKKLMERVKYEWENFEA